MSKDDEIRKHGAVTEYRPHEDDVSGGSDKSVQAEALGAEGSSELSNAGATSGSAAGRIENLDPNPAPHRHGDEKPENRGGLTN
ncbi:MAG: hypothetical protein JO197_02470 [Acidobacteria bacterium]|nr:hypothetical protein [Acidobacteriota bacterium]MBV9476756.1 hypothetical protein [Acidobacteriota bacterium]